MPYSIYQKILEDCENMDSAKRGKLLRIYLHIRCVGLKQISRIC